MKAPTVVLLIATHCVVGFVGFSLGIYALPILTAPPSPSVAEIKKMSAQANYTAKFRRDLEDSDALHWGEGAVSVGANAITLMGKLAPGPDYKLYLSPEFIETESDFIRFKTNMVRVGDVNTFENFVVTVPPNVDPSKYNSVIVWCEAFGQFITAARYQ